MSGRSGTGGQSLKSRQFYEMFRSQSRVLKAKEAHDELKTADQAEQQRLDKLYTILKEKEKEKESGSGKNIAATPAAAPAATTPAAPAPAAPAPAAAAPAPAPKAPIISITTEEKETVVLPANGNADTTSAAATTTTSASKPPASPRSQLSAGDAAKEVAELDRLMQLSLRENDELSKKLLEMEIKMKLLEHNLPASKMEELKSGSLKGSDLREAEPKPAPVAAPASTGSDSSSSNTGAIATYDEGQKKVVFSQKLRTREYFEMFKTRSKLIPPGGRQGLTRATPVTAQDTQAATAAAAATSSPPAAAAAPAAAATPTVTVTPPSPAVPPAAPAAAAPAPASEAPAPTVEEAKAEVAELNDMVENSLQENEELQKEIANLRVKLEEAEQKAHKYKHKTASAKKKAVKHSAHLVSLFIEFLESGGKERESLIDMPGMKEAFAKYDAAIAKSK